MNSDGSATAPTGVSSSIYPAVPPPAGNLPVSPPGASAGAQTEIPVAPVPDAAPEADEKSAESSPATHAKAVDEKIISRPDGQRGITGKDPQIPQPAQQQFQLPSGMVPVVAPTPLPLPQFASTHKPEHEPRGAAAPADGTSGQSSPQPSGIHIAPAVELRLRSRLDTPASTDTLKSNLAAKGNDQTATAVARTGTPTPSDNSDRPDAKESAPEQLDPERPRAATTEAPAATSHVAVSTHPETLTTSMPASDRVAPPAEAAPVPASRAPVGPPAAAASAPLPNAHLQEPIADQKAPQSAVRSVALEFTPDGASDVRLRLSERAGEVHISLHSQDSALSGRLHDGVNDLVGSLSRAGYEAESWTSGQGRQNQRQPQQEEPSHSQRPAAAADDDFSDFFQPHVQENR